MSHLFLSPTCYSRFRDRRINSNFPSPRDGKNSFAGLEIQSVSRRFLSRPENSEISLIDASQRFSPEIRLETRSYFLSIVDDQIQWKIRNDKLANPGYKFNGLKLELEHDFERLRSMCGQTARRRLFLEQTTFRISVSGTPPTKIVGVVTRNHNFIQLNVV